MPPTEQVLSEIPSYPGEKVYFDIQNQEHAYNWSIENQSKDQPPMQLPSLPKRHHEVQSSNQVHLNLAPAQQPGIVQSAVQKVSSAPVQHQQPQ